jgi:nitronate monooxygenase
MTGKTFHYFAREQHDTSSSHSHPDLLRTVSVTRANFVGTDDGRILPLALHICRERGWARRVRGAVDAAESHLDWAKEVRKGSDGVFQLNLWVPDPRPAHDPAHEERIRAFLAQWGPEVPLEAGNAVPPDFDAQCEALLNAAPAIVSSVMGLFPPEFVLRLKTRKITWFANISTVAEARAAEAAGADVVVAQGMEAGGHRGCFDATRAEREMVGLFALLPAVVDAVRIPVVATGGIADHRGVAAALMLGASAAQIGTGFLRCPEAKIHPAWADALAVTPPEGTSSVFSGRAGRSITTDYVRAATSRDAPAPAPYPVQRGLTSALRENGGKSGDVHRMQAWAGQSAAMARADRADELYVAFGKVLMRCWREPFAFCTAPSRSSPVTWAQIDRHQAEPKGLGA